MFDTLLFKSLPPTKKIHFFFSRKEEKNARSFKKKIYLFILFYFCIYFSKVLKSVQKREKKIGWVVATLIEPTVEILSNRNQTNNQTDIFRRSPFSTNSTIIHFAPFFILVQKSPLFSVACSQLSAVLAATA